MSKNFEVQVAQGHHDEEEIDHSRIEKCCGISFWSDDISFYDEKNDSHKHQNSEEIDDEREEECEV